MDRVTVAIAGAVTAGIVAAVTLLAWHGTIDGQAAIGFFSGISLAGIVGGGVHIGVGMGARAARRDG